MNRLEAFVLGVVQGLGEFLPISSSGHLIVVPWLLGWPPHGLAFDVALHLGTLVAVAAAFAPDWGRMLTAGVRGLARGRPFADGGEPPPLAPRPGLDTGRPRGPAPRPLGGDRVPIARPRGRDHDPPGDRPLVGGSPVGKREGGFLA